MNNNNNCRSKQILFLSDYPTEDNIQDGMLQRIKAVDQEFQGFNRIYLSVSFFDNVRNSHMIIDDRIEVYHLNFFVHFFIICRLLNDNENIYIHSVHNFFKFYFFSLKKKKVTLDVHGVVPEELLFMGHRMKYYLFNIIEKRIFRYATNFVYVSMEMQKYYENKYPWVREMNNIVKPIYPRNVLMDVDHNVKDSLIKELSISNDDVVFIYSGNIQKWQNVDLAINCMVRIARPNYFFMFLTGDPEEMNKMIKSKVNNSIRFIVRKVSPSDLPAYYSIAHYGFILRDDHILNIVAAPTKLIEYLYFGIIPVVKSEKIGDAYEMGYEYVKYNIDVSYFPRKSTRNRAIANQMSTTNCDMILSRLY